jgi:2-dehydropantoate 2-reductase
MRIAIVGTGGVGGYLGAKLWKAGNDVIFTARSDHLATMQHNGLTLVSPEGNITVQSTFTDTLTNQSSVDLAIIAVKSFDTLSACRLIGPVIKDDTMVLSIQNGIENEGILAQEIGSHHIIGGVAYIFSTITKPGIVRHQGIAKFKFGELNGETSNRCHILEEVFKQAEIDANAVNDIQQLLWEKWIFICGLGGMTAYARKPIGEILADVKLNDMLSKVVSEAAAVGRAKKIVQSDDIEEKDMAYYGRLPYDSASSMYYDVIHGKRVEVEALNGAAVRFGKELNIPTPANEKIFKKLQPLI